MSSKNTDILTKFEKVRLLGIRAQQISMGAPVHIDIGDLTDSLLIAEREFNEGKIPLIIIRKYPNGTTRRIPTSK